MKNVLIFGAVALCAGVFVVMNQFVSDLEHKDKGNIINGESAHDERYNLDDPVGGLGWWLLAWRSANGQIPPNPLGPALEQRDAYLQEQSGPDGFSDGGAARMNWVARGPANVGGRTRSVIIHPDNPDIIWAGATGGGVWKSADGGNSWFATNGKLQNYTVSCMAIHPTNPDVLYAGTGEGFTAGNIARGGGIYKSTDGGMTWSLLNSTRFLTVVNRISISADGNTIFASTTGGGEGVEVLFGGIIRSMNGGVSWSNVQTAQGYTSYDVVFHPTNPLKALANLVYVCGFNEGCCPEPFCLVFRNKVIYTANGGNTWINATRGASDFFIEGVDRRIELAYSKSDPEIVYALNHHPDTVYGGVVSRSTTGGQSFTIQASFTNSIETDAYKNTVWVSPTNPDLVVVGGKTLHRSTDQGLSFTLIADGYILESTPHVDQHCVVADPDFNGITNKRVYVCNDGGIFRTEDITTVAQGCGWQPLNTSFQTTQFYAGVGNGNTGTVIGGTQDNATLPIFTGSTEAPYWMIGGDGGFSAIDSSNSNYLYGEAQGLQIYRSSNGGPSATPIHYGITDVGTLANFVAPFILDPGNQLRMLAGGSSVWRTNDVRVAGQPIWHKIRQNPEAIRIGAISIAPTSSDIAWVAEHDVAQGTPGGVRLGRLYKTSNATKTDPALGRLGNH